MRKLELILLDSGRLTTEQIVFFLDALAAQGNVEWKDKGKTRAFVYFRTPAQWGAQIYEWAMSQGKGNTVCTLFEIAQGEDSAGTEFHGLDTDTLVKALRSLEKDRKAELFASASADQMGVKFFQL